MYLLRLDDASEYMDVEKWSRVESLLDKYTINPIVGIIPNNQDNDILSKYQKDSGFWDKARAWKGKNWVIALHGYNHVYKTKSGGINPINLRSEFAEVTLDEQKQKIRDGLKVLTEHKLHANVFFPPSHTFDMNTLEALKAESNIRIIIDTIANDVYKIDDFYFIPQQSGHVRNLPFKVVTFCYHPNDMNKKDFDVLEDFIKTNKDKFISFEDLSFKDRKFGVYDKVLRKFYFSIRYVRDKLIGKGRE